MFEHRADTYAKLEGEPDIRGSHSCRWDIPRRGPAQPLSPDRKPQAIRRATHPESTGLWDWERNKWGGGAPQLGGTRDLMAVLWAWICGLQPASHSKPKPIQYVWLFRRANLSQLIKWFSSGGVVGGRNLLETSIRKKCLVWEKSVPDDSVYVLCLNSDSQV